MAATDNTGSLENDPKQIINSGVNLDSNFSDFVIHHHRIFLATWFFKNITSLIGPLYQDAASICYRIDIAFFGCNRTFELVFCLSRRGCCFYNAFVTGVVTLRSLFTPVMVGI